MLGDGYESFGHHILHFPEFFLIITTLANQVGYFNSHIKWASNSFPTSSSTTFLFSLLFFLFRCIMGFALGRMANWWHTTLELMFGMSAGTQTNRLMFFFSKSLIFSASSIGSVVPIYIVWRGFWTYMYPLQSSIGIRLFSGVSFRRLRSTN